MPPKRASRQQPSVDVPAGTSGTVSKRRAHTSATAPPEHVALFPGSLLYAATQIPQFALAAFVSLLLQAILSSVVAQVCGHQLAGVSRSLNNTSDIIGITMWKVLELALGWFVGSFDSADMAHFTLLTAAPQAFFLWEFYEVPWLPLVLNLLAGAGANYLAFRISHPTTAVHKSQANATRDPTIWISTTLFVAILYVLPMLFSLATYLPTHLAVHFDGLKTLQPVQTASLQGLLGPFILFGYSATQLLLEPIVHRPSLMAEEEKDPLDIVYFEPENASLMEHLIYNIDSLMFYKHLPPVGQALVARTVLLAIWTTANSAFLSCATVEGCDTASGAWLWGPLGWGGVWGVGAALAGIALGWVGGVY